jgi:hypothetical protein
VLDKFFTFLRISLVVFLIYPGQSFADHVPTQPAYNQSIALDTSTGDLTIGIYSSDGFEDSPPEKYTIFFTISDNVIDTTTSFCVSTSFGHGTNLTWQYHVFSLEDLQYYFENPYGTFRTKIRSDNDTDNSFSTLTAEQTISIPNQLPFVNLGEWTAPTDTCNDTSTTTTTSSTTTTTTSTTTTTTSTTTTTTTTSTTTTTVPPTTSTTTTTVPPTTTTTTVPPTTTTTTTSTTTTTLPPKPEPEPQPEIYIAPEPEPEPEPEIVVVIIGDEEVEYTEEQIEQGDAERDQQRTKNQELYGDQCFATDEAVARGDCGDLEELEVIDEEYEEIEIIEEKDEEEVSEEFITEEMIEILDFEAELDVLELEELEYIDDNLEVIEFFEFDDVKELEELVETLIDVEKYIEEELGDFEDILIIEIPEDIDIEDIEIIFEEEEIDEEIIDEVEPLVNDETDKPIVEEDTQEVLVEVPILVEDVEVELTEEEIEEQVEELETIITEVIDLPVEIEEDEEITEQEKEEIVEEYVKNLDTTQVFDIAKTAADTPIKVLAEASTDVIEIIEEVVEQSIEIIQEDITQVSEEDVQVVSEILFDDEEATEDVEIIAEAVKEDENVAEAVETFVSKKVENADIENYTLADAVVEVAIENFIDDPISALKIDVQNIVLSEIGQDLTQDQKTKAAETVVPVVIVGQIIATPLRRRF